MGRLNFTQGQLEQIISALRYIKEEFGDNENHEVSSALSIAKHNLEYIEEEFEKDSIDDELSF